jgi:hypothetical protein
MSDRMSGQSPHVPPVDLAVFRVEKNAKHQIRTLAGTGPGPDRRLLGYMTHWRHGATRVCVGVPDCEPALHRIDPIWYGYLAVERWEEQLQLWLPCALQVTESLELDFRGRLERGQYWTLAMAAMKKKGNPTRGQLDGRCDGDELPHPFDILPVLRALFHCPQLQPPCLPNPAPGRIALAPSTGAPPPGSKAAEQAATLRLPVESEGVGASYREVKKRMEERKAQSNGKH